MFTDKLSTALNDFLARRSPGLMQSAIFHELIIRSFVAEYMFGLRSFITPFIQGTEKKLFASKFACTHVSNRQQVVYRRHETILIDALNHYAASSLVNMTSFVPSLLCLFVCNLLLFFVLSFCMSIFARVFLLYNRGWSLLGVAHTARHFV